MNATKAVRQEQIDNLREWFPKGSTVYTILRHVARSGMSRTIGVLALLPGKGTPDFRHPNYAVSVVLGDRLDTSNGRDGVRVSGCGMDMGFDLAYRLGQALYGDGYALKHCWL